MAPSSYQPPTLGDKSGLSTKSQSVQSNLSQSQSTVADVLNEKGKLYLFYKIHAYIYDVVRILKEKSIGALVISNDQGAALGILSERDIVRRMAETLGQTLPQLVGVLMTHNVETCTPQDSILDVLNRMSKGRFRHMPVITDGRLGRIITIGDLVQFWLQELEYEALQMRQMIVG